MTDSDTQAFAARQVLAGTFHGVLSTHSLELAGYPFGSVVPYVLDQEGLPLLLLSPLSQHTKNLAADSRCGLTVVEEGEGDVQQRGRLSALGEIIAARPDADAEHYFGYFPQARLYLEQLGFVFYRFTPTRFHWNGGFATARWLGTDRILRANPLSPESRRRIIAHMNQDHKDALRGYLRALDGADCEQEVLMVGIDAEGIDVRVDDRPRRIPLLRPIASPGEAREVLVEMARQPVGD
ncbi:HugZ family pyridoxamine 5'-phosphate oxidase [Halochromatium sp.]